MHGPGPLDIGDFLKTPAAGEVVALPSRDAAARPDPEEDSGDEEADVPIDAVPDAPESLMPGDMRRTAFELLEAMAHAAANRAAAGCVSTVTRVPNRLTHFGPRTPYAAIFGAPAGRPQVH